ncbi:MAG: ribosome maturation factor RimM [Thermicanus sp.]|nr:ribosome maturation factor RimM [Thermicanus sp.]
MAEKFYTVGKIVNTHGIRGELRVISTTDFPEERFTPGATLYLFAEDGSSPLPLSLESHRSHKQFEILKFKGYDDMNTVEKWKGSLLKVSERERKSLPPGEYYFDQIIGLTVETEEGERVGVVKEILQPGANDVWVVSRPSRPDLLLPYIDECIKKVDLVNEKVVVHLLEGLDQ